MLQRLLHCCHQFLVLAPKMLALLFFVFKKSRTELRIIVRQVAVLLPTLDSRQMEQCGSVRGFSKPV